MQAIRVKCEGINRRLSLQTYTTRRGETVNILYSLSGYERLSVSKFGKVSFVGAQISIMQNQLTTNFQHCKVGECTKHCIVL